MLKIQPRRDILGKLGWNWSNTQIHIKKQKYRHANPSYSILTFVSVFSVNKELTDFAVVENILNVVGTRLTRSWSQELKKLEFILKEVKRSTMLTQHSIHIQYLSYMHAKTHCWHHKYAQKSRRWYTTYRHIKPLLVSGTCRPPWLACWDHCQLLHDWWKEKYQYS